MIRKLLLNTKMIWMIFIQILKNAIQIKKSKILIVLDDIIAHMLNNKKRNQIVTELFIRGSKLDISPVFITQSYFAVLKNIRLNCTHYFIIQISNKEDIQQIAFNQSSDIDFKDFMSIYKKCTIKPYSFWLLILFLHQIILYILEKIF